jgi:hypothetical protein
MPIGRVAAGHAGAGAAPGSPAMVLVMWTDALDEAYGKLVAAGVPVVQPPRNTGNSRGKAGKVSQL